MDIDNILLDLEVIKQLNPHDKLAVNVLPGNTYLCVHSSGFLSSLKRYYNGYNRNDCIKYLEDLINKIEKSIKIIVNGSHDELSITLRNAINNALNGLNNLKETYNDDSIIVAKLVLLINKLKDYMLILNNENTLNNNLLNNVSASMMTNIESNNELE